MQTPFGAFDSGMVDLKNFEINKIKDDIKTLNCRWCNGKTRYIDSRYRWAVCRVGCYRKLREHLALEIYVPPKPKKKKKSKKKSNKKKVGK